MNKSPITYDDPRLIGFLENGAHSLRIEHPDFTLNKTANDAEKGIEIPDWNIPVAEDMDADAFIQTLIEMERTVFWQKAEEAGIRVDLLREVGYEFDYLTENMAWEASKYLDRNLEGWPVSSKSRELLVKMLNAVVFGYEIQYVIEQAKNHSLCAEEEVTILDESFFEEHNDEYVNNNVTREVALLFIDEFEDSLTSKRRELLNLYGAQFVALPEYKSFIYNRGRFLIRNLHLLAGKTDWLRGKLQLMDVQKILHKGKSFTLQSNIIKAERSAIDASASSILDSLLQHDSLSLWDIRSDDTNYWFKEIARMFLRYSGAYKEREYRWNSEEDEIKEKLKLIYKWVKQKEELFRHTPIDQAFYYGAHSIINWPEKKIDDKKYNMTDRCIFLYRLAHVCGFDKVGETLDLKKADIRKPITDRIKSFINKISKISTKGELDKILYRRQLSM